MSLGYDALRDFLYREARCSAARNLTSVCAIN